MRCLFVFCHPSGTSFAAAILDTARTAVHGAGHEIRVIDLYGEHFDPVMSTEEWHNYLPETARNVAALRGHVEALQWAESLVLIFPTWMYGPPALLKGWMERVWLPGIAFEIPPGRQRRAVGKLHNIRQLTVITTSGSPRWWLFLIRDPCRSTFTRGLRVLFHRRCRVRWLQMYSMNHSTGVRRRRFLGRVRKALSAL